MQSTTLNMEQLLDKELMTQARKTIQKIDYQNLPKTQQNNNNKITALSESNEKANAAISKNSSDSKKTLYEKILNDLIDLLAQTLKLKSHQIDGEENIVNYGVDSIAITEYINKLSQRYQISLSATILFEERNLSGLANILATRFKSKVSEIYSFEENQKLEKSEVFNPGDVSFEVEMQWLQDYENLLKPKEINDGIYAVEQQKDIFVNQSITEVIKGSSLVLLNNASLPFSEFVIVGQGAPLIFIPGIYANAISFKEQINKLKSHYKCYIYHPPGHGNSELPASLSSLENVVDYLHESLLLLGATERLTFIAWSLGASIALEFAIKYPKMLKKLILIGGTASNITVTKNVEFDTLPENVKLEFIKNMPKFTKSFMDTYSMIFENWNCEENCKKIKADTLLIHGKQDSVVDVTRANILHNLIVKSRCEIIDDAGHLIPLTHAKEMNVIIADFLK